MRLNLWESNCHGIRSRVNWEIFIQVILNLNCMGKHLLGLRWRFKKIIFFQIFKTIIRFLIKALKIKIVIKSNLRNKLKIKFLINSLVDFSPQKIIHLLVKVLCRQKVLHLFLCFKNQKKMWRILHSAQKKFAYLRKPKMEYLVNNLLLYKLL